MRRRRAATKTIAFVRGMAKRGVRVASVCSGAYVLAEAGLLDGKRATTHWQRTRHFLSAYPKVKLEPDRIFVRDGNIWTSAGITAGIDLSLAMIAEDYGEEVAQKTARQLVLYHRRSRRAVAILLAAGIEGADRAVRAAACLGARTSRRAADGGGHGRAGRHERAAFYPRLRRRDRHDAVQGGRAAAHRGGAARVQSSSEAIERVAETTGFRDPERMRRAFIRAFGQPPQSLRRAARAGYGERPVRPPFNRATGHKVLGRVAANDCRSPAIVLNSGLVGVDDGSRNRDKAQLADVPNTVVVIVARNWWQNSLSTGMEHDMALLSVHIFSCAKTGGRRT